MSNNELKFNLRATKMKILKVEWQATDKNGNLIEETTKARICENIANEKEIILRVNLYALLNAIAKLRGLSRVNIKSYNIEGVNSL